MIKPIETVYKGYRFRSRLEARWATFFDACGVKWEYEPEGFDLGNGLYYLPDFLLHDVYMLHGGGDTTRYFGDLWVEVKGKMAKTDVEKLICFESFQPILIVTNIPVGDNIDDLDDYIIDSAYDYNLYSSVYPFNFESIDYDHYAAFPCIDKRGHFAIVGGDYTSDRDDEATEKAYRLARQARFEKTA